MRILFVSWTHTIGLENWDETLIKWYYDLKKEGYNPIIGGYLPYYNPFNDPADRVQEPWQSELLPSILLGPSLSDQQELEVDGNI